MMSRHFGLSSEPTGAKAKILLHTKNQLSGPYSFFNQFVADIYIYIYTGCLLSSFPSLIRYKISYTQTILVIMVYRYCNSNFLNDFKRFFESMT